MTNDDIKKAAISAIHDHYNCNGKYPCSEKSYCQFCSGYNSAFDCNECGADDFNEGFLDGARWRIENAWHDAREVPKINEVVLVEYKFGDQSFAYITTVNDSNWEYKSNRYNYTRWAYIADLMPDRKEEER